MAEASSNISEENSTTPINEINLQHLYAEGSSEFPGAPETLTLQEPPHLDFQINIQTRKDTTAAAQYIVELKATVTATINHSESSNETKTLFLVEVKQGGLFSIKGFDTVALDQVLNIHCPTVLYPYIRAFVSDLISRGGFSPLYLPAVDFNHLYAQHKKSAATPS